MNLIEAAKELLYKHEGFRHFPYRCTSGKLTIGIGRNIEDRGISLEEALYLLENDINIAIKDLSKYSWFNKLDDGRKLILIDMYVNLGEPRLLGFKKMITALVDGDFDRASEEMLDSVWASQVGDRAKTLSDMMRNREGGTPLHT